MASLGELGVIEVTVQKVSVKATSFVLELDGMKVVKMELDGVPLHLLTNLHLIVDWEEGELPKVCTCIPKLTMERVLGSMPTALQEQAKEAEEV
jgi:hypothetical protein